MGSRQGETVRTLQRLDPDAFESFVAALFARKGWDTRVTPTSNDRGVDVRATRGSGSRRERILIQAKRYASGNKVTGPDVQQYAGLPAQENADRVIVVTTSSFTEPAHEIADRHNEHASGTSVVLLNGSELATMIANLEAYDLLSRYAPESRPPSRRTDTSTRTRSATRSRNATQSETSITAALGESLRTTGRKFGYYVGIATVLVLGVPLLVFAVVFVVEAASLGVSRLVSADPTRVVRTVGTGPLLPILAFLPVALAGRAIGVDRDYDDRYRDAGNAAAVSWLVWAALEVALSAVAVSPGSWSIRLATVCALFGVLLAAERTDLQPLGRSGPSCSKRSPDRTGQSDSRRESDVSVSVERKRK